MASVDTMAFSFISSPSICAVSSKAKHPICSHCNIAGHTVDKCYKLHGYPPSYKSRMNPTGNKAFSSSQSVQANQVSSSSLGSPVATLFVSQCQQIIDFLHSQLRASPSLPTSSSSLPSFSSSPTDGPFVASFTNLFFLFFNSFFFMDFRHKSYTPCLLFS